MTQTGVEEVLAVAEAAAEAAGAVLLEYWRHRRFRPRFKGPKNPVTEADCRAERAVREVIWTRFPDHVVLGEEDAAGGGPAAGPWQWLVDPLDGTNNFLHGVPHWSVSVAVLYRGEPLAGVVLDPLRRERFVAFRGGGAWLNGRPIQPAGGEELDRSLIGVSIPSSLPLGVPADRQLVRLLHACASLRRLGCASLDLCYVACGRLDAFWACAVHPWDIAAGWLLAQCAGAVVTASDGVPLTLDRADVLACGTPVLHGRLVALLAEAGRQ